MSETLIFFMKNLFATEKARWALGTSEERFLFLGPGNERRKISILTKKSLDIAPGLLHIPYLKYKGDS